MESSQCDKTLDTSHHVTDAAIDFIGGTAGGIASVYVGQPLDTVKVKLQTFPGLYTNALRCFTETLRQDGVVRGLYAGTVPSLLAQVSENAVLFLAYGMCQKLMMVVRGKSDINKLDVVDKAAAGSMAGIFSGAVLCPTELIKCKMQAMREMAETGRGLATDSMHGLKRGKIGPWTVTRSVLRTDGARGLFKGMAPTLTREMFGNIFFFGAYELCRKILTPTGKSSDDLGAIQTIACGGLGGFAFWIAVFPADVIKSRVQVQGHGAGRRSFVALLLHIARTESPRALYKGLGPTLTRTVPATGALFFIYESTKKHLGDWAYSH